MQKQLFTPLVRLILTLLLALNPKVTLAAIFNAADFMLPGQQSVGILGDALLSNPAGEGIEFRAKQGVNNLVNIDAILGMGSKDRKFRAGGQADINFFPDAEGQFGISLLTGGIYIKRADHGGVQFSTAPIVHKSIIGITNYPVNIYLGVPVTIELYKGKYTTGTQLAFGALWDTNANNDWFIASEAGVTLSKSESFIALGFGTRFGTTGKSSTTDTAKKHFETITKSADKIKTVDEEETYEDK